MRLGLRRLGLRQRLPLPLLLPLALLWAAGTTGTLLAPQLLDEAPLLLALLSPRTAFVAAAALENPGWVLVPACTVRLSLGDPVHFVLGRRLLAGGLPRCLDRAGRLVQRLGLPAVALVPTGPVMLAAGAAGVPTARAVAANLVGTLARVLVTWRLAQEAPSLVGAVARVAVVAAPAFALTALLVTGLGRVRRRGRAEAHRHPSRHAPPRARAALDPGILAGTPG